MKTYKKNVFKGKLLKVFRSRKVLPQGRVGYFEEIEHPGAALVVPFVGNKILFLRQYRGVIGKYIWELPAGKLDSEESPLECAKRELVEETGYIAEKMERVGYIYTTPGFCNEKIYIFKAICSKAGRTNKEKDEIIKTKLLDRGHIKQLFRKNLINDSKTIAGLSMLGLV